ncbi:unnamed protein product [Anisakis simplex]|uniref:Uncharacterized protein n=1 Tax=Anisakis simplex TaxID=6269 RepID=A0A0M3KCS9_ANISI|nr:unnamed protein product [Anisakis simplex]
MEFECVSDEIRYVLEVFVRRSLGSTSATRTPSTRLASTASSSSETNSLSHRSSLRANQKRSTDLEVSLDDNNAKCCIENYEYFQAVIHDTPPMNPSNPLKNGSSIGDCRVSKPPSSTDEKRMKPTESTTHKQLSKTNHTNSTLSNNHAQTNGYIPNMPRRNGFRGLPNTSYTDQQVNNGLSDGEKLFDSQILPIMVRAERVNQHSNDEKFFNLNRKKAYSNSDETSIGIDNFMKTKDDEQTRSASFLHSIASQCTSSSNEHSSTRHNETDRRNAINSAEGSLHNYENVDVELKLPNELSISTGH